MTSTYRLVGLGAMPVGSAAGGLLARAYGLTAPFVVAGVVLLACTLAAVRWLPRSVVERAGRDRPAGEPVGPGRAAASLVVRPS